MTETSPPPAHQPLAARSLEPLSPERHAAWRLKTADFGFAREAPFIPVVVSEFARAARTYPIVFSASDPSPLALLGIDRANLFLGDASGDAATPGIVWREGYVPAYVRRYPFGYLRVGESDRFVLGIDPGCEAICTDGTEGQPLFEDGAPAAIVQTALAICQAFQGQAEASMAFVRALEDRGLLVERTAELTLDGGGRHRLTGFRIVDRAKFDALDGPTIVEWHAKGWLEAVSFHLASLDLLAALVRRHGDLQAALPDQVAA
ncbi:SapC family protein [Sphingomonas pollutisoli]|uniref:SapC family protein n=1 Tax=Sphingomonas pollutisoli TaxID=3030829 RepID=UPI0023B91DA0|nr:SapC family protein [Sphingomonas pollutisoli]